MQPQSMFFKPRASAALHNDTLQAALHKFGTAGLASLRARAVAEFGPEMFETLRDAGAAIRDRSLTYLDTLIERFEAEATRCGASVLFAENGKDVGDLVLDICRRHGLTKAVKSKSMVSEEAALNDALEANGVTPVETDLGEYIIQLAKEPPSHIVGPALHKSKAEVADLFEKHHNKPRKTDIGQMTREAREALREHFLSADVGISGGNFLIAETGSGVIVTNEGNGRMVTTLPRVHICITGIEKVIPTLEDFSVLLRLLTRSATGQHISNYVSMFTGPRREGDRDGPEHMYFILVDAGRTGLLGGDMQEMLRCIRCGACMNHCPVYGTVGGHAYGWVYPGPMGSVLTPAYIGLEKALDLPHAATLCGACSVVCPVKIPLPDLLRKLREKQVERGLRPRREMLALRVWSWFAQRPGLYAMASAVGLRVLRLLGNRQGMIKRLPLGKGWTQGRFFPAPRAKKTFRALYAAGKGKGKGKAGEPRPSMEKAA
jgi:L-lactate dehydrogenase complex protein LldF